MEVRIGSRARAQDVVGPLSEHLVVRPSPQTTHVLALRPMPDAAAALRGRLERIVQRWTDAVDRHPPHADPLTVKHIRDSIPLLLEKIASALESGTPGAITVLTEVGTAHGVAR